MESRDILLTLEVPAGAGRTKLADAIFKLGRRVMEWEEQTLERCFGTR